MRACSIGVERACVLVSHPLVMLVPMSEHFTFMDELLVRTTASIHQCGRHIQYVLGDDDLPPWAYTIGLVESLGHPELMVFGLAPQSASDVLNRLYDRISGGSVPRVGRGQRQDLSGEPFRLLPVPDEYWDTSLFAMWLNYYGALRALPGEPAALQVVWADRRRRFPWHARHDPDVGRLQPILDDIDPVELPGLAWDDAA